MLDFIKKNLLITIIFIITLFIGFLTFLTFIDKSFVKLNDKNLQFLLIVNVVLLIVFVVLIFLEVKNSLKNDIDISGARSNTKYITFFSLFTLIPSVLISLFSLFLLSFALDKYLDKKITTVVNNSYEIAKNYIEEVKTKTQSEIILIAYDLNNSANYLKLNPEKLESFLNTQKLIRNIDEIHIIDIKGNLIFTTLKTKTKYLPPIDEALKMVTNDERPLKIINAYENQSASLIRLENFDEKYLYVTKYLDVKISNYLKDSQEALNFYYTVENKQTGIKVSFVLIYLVVVTLLLFLSISIAIRFSSRFFRSINNLIYASANIGKGNLETKVPIIKTDKELETLNKNFNSMILQLKDQQQKLLLNERHEAWDSVARKLAHEIKNPLTPIQLTIDRLKSKYSEVMSKNDKENFNEYLQIINKQIFLIENLVNEFSDFARMPKPTFKENDLIKIINENIKLLKEIETSIKFKLNFDNEKIIFLSDSEQLSRVFFNLIKNSIESIVEKKQINPNFKGEINIEITDKSDYIEIILIDNGIGFSEKNLNKILKPYFTTKTAGTGLGLSIVNKIINDHNGTINFSNTAFGAKVVIKFIKYAR